MRPRETILVKFGGSLLTNKGSPERPAYRQAQGDRLARELARGLRHARAQAVLVAGAGAFGHPLALRHRIGTRRLVGAQGDRIRSRVQTSISRLREAVVASLHRAHLGAVGVPVEVLAAHPSGPNPNPQTVRLLQAMRLLVVTGGDVIRDPPLGLRVLGGDEILDRLARSARPRRVVFATDVDGLELDGRLVLDLPASAAREALRRVPPGRDATGQMRGKLQHAIAIARRGIPVALVNGGVPGRLRDAVAGRRVRGTRITPRRA